MIILLRHGETFWNREARIQGHSESDLTPRGVEQARAMADLAAELVQRDGRDGWRLVASPIGRAMRTAQAVADATGLPVDVSAIPETAALGAAYLARVTAGLEPDTRGATSWSRTDRTVEPRAAWAGPCGDRYQTFLDRTGA